MTHNFALLALDQVVNNAAKMRYMTGGRFKMPIVFRGPNGPAEFLASQHSQSFASYWAHIPGLKVIAPYTPADAYGLLKSAIRDDDPVVVLEAEMLYGVTGEVPDGETLFPIGAAEVRRSGTDITLVSFSKPVRYCLDAAVELDKLGVSAEVVDLRSLRPLDMETVLRSVEKTNRAVVVDEAWPTASVGSHVAWRISRDGFDHLDAPVELVASEDVPMPYNHALELAVQPNSAKIVAAAKRALYME